MLLPSFFFFFFNDTATTEIYTLSLPTRRSSDLSGPGDRTWTASRSGPSGPGSPRPHAPPEAARPGPHPTTDPPRDRKSTRLNSSHSQISYAVFCLKKKKIQLPRVESVV